MAPEDDVDPTTATRGLGERPPPRPALARQVAQQLRTAIIRGELTPGQRLVERRLCRLHAVSRTPFREALKILEDEGLVTIALNKGARVCDVTPGALSDLFDVLADLEALAAAGAAERMTDCDMAQLETLHARMLAAYRGGDRDTYFDLNSSIHDLIVEMSRNRALATAREMLVGQAARGRYLAIGNQTRWHRSVAEHETLMDALRRRDPKEAKRIWAMHLRGTGRRLRASVPTPGLSTRRDAEAP